MQGKVLDGSCGKCLSSRKHESRKNRLENVVFVFIAFILVTDILSNLVARGRDNWEV